MRQRTLALVATLAITAACASLSVKQSVSAAHQTVRGALVAFDEFERDQCKPTGALLNHCSANPVVVTDTDHQRLSRTLADAYRLDVRVGCAISGNLARECDGLGVMPWFTGQAAPVDLALLQAVAGQLKQAVQEMTLSPAVTAFLAKAEAVVLKIQDLVRRFTGGL